jgi:hypothetical protein
MSKRDETLQKAFSLHRSGNFAEAAKLYRKIIRQDPQAANALHSLAIIGRRRTERRASARSELLGRVLRRWAGSVILLQQAGGFRPMWHLALTHLAQ